MIRKDNEETSVAKPDRRNIRIEKKEKKERKEKCTVEDGRY